jgi:hypothetical protein
LQAEITTGNGVFVGDNTNKGKIFSSLPALVGLLTDKY